MKYSLGAIGGGVLGQAMKSYYPELRIYDKYKPIDPLEEVLACDIIFICVPTPFNGSFDGSQVEETFKHLRGLKDKLVVIRSTVTPGTTERLQEEYPELIIFFNPEFLTEKTATEDFKNPDKQLVGYTSRSRPHAQALLELLPSAPYQKLLLAREAELVKYAVNSYYATKVIFGNTLYDIAHAIGADYEQVKEAFVSDKRVFDSHFDIFHSGYRGYGGKCLPKDTRSLIEFAERVGVDPVLLRAVEEVNNQLTAGNETRLQSLHTISPTSV